MLVMGNGVDPGSEQSYKCGECLQRSAQLLQTELKGNLPSLQLLAPAQGTLRVRRYRWSVCTIDFLKVCGP